MGEDCWKIIGLASTVVAGLVVGMGILWRAYQSSLRENRHLQLKLIEAKDEHTHELEGLMKVVQDRLRGTHGRAP